VGFLLAQLILITSLKQYFMGLIKGDSQVNKIVDKSCEFIENKVLTVRDVFQIILFLFLLGEHVLQLAKTSLENILLLILNYTNLVRLLKLLSALEIL
jgi:hypothetical protein